MSTRTLQHEIGKKKPFEHAEEEAYLNLIRSAASLAVEFERLFRRHDLSEAAYNALRILRGHRGSRTEAHGLPCSQIGEIMVARVPDVTRLADRLEESGLVERVRCEKDRRVVYVRITEKGLKVLAALDKPVIELHKRQMSHLSARELGELSRLLYKARHPEQWGDAAEHEKN